MTICTSKWPFEPVHRIASPQLTRVAATEVWPVASAV